MRGRTRAIGIAAALLASSWTAGAAGEPETAPDVFASADDELIVGGSRLPSTTGTRAFQASVLAGEALEVGQSASVADALRFVPALHLVQEGSPGGRAALSLRGLDPNHVVVLVDGVRVNDPTNTRGGSFDPSTLALVDLERIEVVRGPLSSVHGADALGGVIQVVTRGVEPDAPFHSRVRARAGRYHAGEVAGQASAGLAGVAGLSLGSALATSRDPHSDGGFDSASFQSKLRLPLFGDFALEAFGRLSESSARAFPESSGGPELALRRGLEDRDTREGSLGLALAGSVADGGARLRLSFGHASRRESTRSPGVAVLPGSTGFDVPPSRSGDEYVRSDVALTAESDLPGLAGTPFAVGPRVLVGAAAAFENGEGDGALDFGGGFVPSPYFERRETFSVFGELEQAFGDWATATTSLRFDSTPDEDDRVSPAVGLVVPLPGTPLSLFGRYGQGFRRPSFYALGNPLVGDPDLALERGRGFEGGLRLAGPGDRLSLSLGYFEIEVENLHDFDAETVQIVARDRLVSRGVEVELGFRPEPRFELVFAGSFNPTDFRGTNRSPLNRPRWRGFAELHYRPHPAWDLAARALAVGPSKAASAALPGRTITLAGYERLDLRATCTPWAGIDLFFEIENATNRTRREAVGFESPGIAPRVGVVFTH